MSESLVPLVLPIAGSDRFEVSGLTVLAPASATAGDFAALRIEATTDIHDAVLTFAAVPTGDLQLSLFGSGHRVTWGTSNRVAIHARMFPDATLDVGADVFCAGVRMIIGRARVEIGEGCLLSDEILIQAGDQHGIFDVASGEYLNQGPKAVRLGRRVWVGRRATLCNRADVGDGSIIGTGAVVAGAIPKLSAAAGNPARVIRQGVSWSLAPAHLSADEAEMLAIIRT